MLKLVDTDAGEVEHKPAGLIFKELLEENEMFDKEGLFYMTFETDEHTYVVSNAGSIGEALLQLEKAKHTMVLKAFEADLE